MPVHRAARLISHPGPHMTISFSLFDEDDPRYARDALLQKIAADPNLPALGSSVSQVVQLASSNDEAVRNLAHFILSDAALTQKILRLANTVAYRTASGAQVTTISRAIFVLGFDAVKTSALALLLVDKMSGKRARFVRSELSTALCASVVGRELARRSHFKDSEEAAVAALFKNMGRLLVAAHDDEMYQQIALLIERERLSPAHAATQVLGCSFEALAESVLREWQIPESIVKALTPIPSGVLKVAKNRNEWIQQVAAFSTTAAALIGHMTEPGTDPASRALLARFGVALNLDQEALVNLFTTVAEQSRGLTDSSNLLEFEEAVPLAENAADETCMTLPQASMSAVNTLPEAALLPVDILMGSAPQITMGAATFHPSGKPCNARELLLAGVQDVSEMLVSEHRTTNNLILLALETLFCSMGFRFATICIRDVKSGQYRARVSLGEQHAIRQQEFVFAPDGSSDLFSLALANDADLLISDAAVSKIAALVPAWHRALLPDARSFIVLPLVIQDKPFGLFYGDRIQSAPEGVPPDETALIKMLKGQVIAALTPR